MSEEQQNIHFSLSSSSNDSSDQETPITITATATTTDQPPPSTTKRPRGRPPGSKNKPKPPLVITQDNEHSMKPLIIEVAPGTDVLEAVIQFAASGFSCLSILSGSGTVAKATLHYPLYNSPAFTLHGPFSILSLSGSFLYPYSHPNPNPEAPPPSPASTFGITLAGLQGQVFGGVIGGKVVAGGNGVKIVCSLFKSPELHRAGGVAADSDESGGGGGDDDDDNGNAGGNGSGRGGGGGYGDPGASTSGGGGGGDENENVTGFNVPNQMSLQLPCYPNFMPWNHPSRYSTY